jgi:quercetin dioxygenase-like cupin family protein
MKVVHINDLVKEENTSSLFTGPVTVQSPVTNKESQLDVNYVHFSNSVRNKFHTHSNDQVLIVTKGRGMVETEDERKEIGIGDVVLVPAGEKHRHGAIEGSEMTHISITLGKTKLEQIEE